MSLSTHEPVERLIETYGQEVYKIAYFYMKNTQLAEDVFQEVCAIGLKGHVLVIRKNLLCSSVVYMGKEGNSPYSIKKKLSWGKIYYLKAK